MANEGGRKEEGEVGVRKRKEGETSLRMWGEEKGRQREKEEGGEASLSSHACLKKRKRRLLGR